MLFFRLPDNGTIREAGDIMNSSLLLSHAKILFFQSCVERALFRQKVVPAGPNFTREGGRDLLQMLPCGC